MSKVFFYDGSVYDPTFAAVAKRMHQEAEVFTKRYEEKTITYDPRTGIERKEVITIDENGQATHKVITRYHKR